jgi:hypothetical protein
MVGGHCGTYCRQGRKYICGSRESHIFLCRHKRSSLSEGGFNCTNRVSQSFDPSLYQSLCSDFSILWPWPCIATGHRVCHIRKKQLLRNHLHPETHFPYSLRLCSVICSQRLDSLCTLSNFQTARLECAFFMPTIPSPKISKTTTILCHNNFVCPQHNNPCIYPCMHACILESIHHPLSYDAQPSMASTALFPPTTLPDSRAALRCTSCFSRVPCNLRKI